jgi:putative DNA primase/helicase
VTLQAERTIVPTNSSATSVNERPDERDPGLLDHHRQFLTDRAVSPTVAAARGYTSTIMPGWLRQVGISVEGSKQVPGLVLPIRDVHGDLVFHQYRPDTPRQRAGKPAKYELPAKARMVLDAPLLTQPKLNDPAAPLWVTEAPVKADAICTAGGVAVGTFGVWGFKGKNLRGGSTMLACWDWIALKGRTVYLVPDSDVATNPKVAQAVSRLGAALESRGADVRYCTIPTRADGTKVGVDDYLAGGGTLQELAANADDEPPFGSQPGDQGGANLFKGADDRFTDARMAETVAAEVLADRYLWVASLGWLTFDGSRWVGCSDVTVGEAVREWVLDRFQAAVTDLKDAAGDPEALDGWRTMLAASKETAVLKLARGIVEHRADQLDAHPDLVNTPAGVVDLHTLQVIDHAPGLLMTRMTSGSYRQGFTHADWTAALEALPEAERTWLQTRIGQAITGHPTPDGILPVCQGSGENGKSLVLTDGTVVALGDYASMASTKLVQGSKGSEHSEEMASLRGKRYLLAEELAEGRQLDVSSLKRIQDVGLITARHVYQRNMSFPASHSLFCTTNYVPVVSEVDHGTWRRLALLRFPYTFRKEGESLESPTDRRADERIKERIKANADHQHDAIVTWAVLGAHRWHTDGPTSLAPTERIKADTLAWRMEADRILGYWSECLVADREAMVAAPDLLTHFNGWLRDNGHNRWSKETFTPRFLQHAETVKHGVDQARTASRAGLARPVEALTSFPDDGEYRPLPNQVWAFRGVRFRTDADPAQAPDQGQPANLPRLPSTSELSLRDPSRGEFPEGRQPRQVADPEAGNGHVPEGAPTPDTTSAEHDGRDPQRDPDGGGVGAAPPFDWQFANEPIGPCVKCGGDCHTPGPDGEPVHPLCFNPAGGRSWQDTAAWKADGRPGLAGPSGGNE